MVGRCRSWYAFPRKSTSGAPGEDFRSPVCFPPSLPLGVRGPPSLEPEMVSFGNISFPFVMISSSQRYDQLSKISVSRQVNFLYVARNMAETLSPWLPPSHGDNVQHGSCEFLFRATVVPMGGPMGTTLHTRDKACATPSA